MNYILHNNFVRNSLLAFAGIPLFLWMQNNLPFHSITLSESISLLTILMFCLMAGEVFWSRLNRYATRDMKLSQVVRIHKIIGYTVVCILLLHPFFLVVPRFFESGISPVDTFVQILTTFNQGIVLGILAWMLLAILGATSLMRRHLPVKHKTWKIFHGSLASILIAVASWHIMDLEYSTARYISGFLVLLASAGILLYGKQTFMNYLKDRGKNK